MDEPTIKHSKSINEISPHSQWQSISATVDTSHSDNIDFDNSSILADSIEKSMSLTPESMVDEVIEPK